MGKLYTDDQIQFLTENSAGQTAGELAQQVNARFGTSYTNKQIKDFCINRKLPCKHERSSQKVTNASVLFSHDVRDYVLANYLGVGPKEMCQRVNDKFGTDYMPQQFRSWYSNHHLRCGAKTGTNHFPEPVADYIRQHSPGPSPTELAAQINTKFGTSYTGHQIGTWRRKRKLAAPRGAKYYSKPVGTMRTDAKGDGSYTYDVIKVADNQWVPVHRLIWEAANGPIPDGMTIVFRDGNTQNCVLSNLAMITRSELTAMTRNELRSDHAETFDQRLAVAKLCLVRNEKKRKRQSSRGKANG